MSWSDDRFNIIENIKSDCYKIKEYNSEPLAR